MRHTRERGKGEGKEVRGGKQEVGRVTSMQLKLEVGVGGEGVLFTFGPARTGDRGRPRNA